MKHFITFMTQQRNLYDQTYDNIEGISALEHDFLTSFPILIPMANSVERGEEIKLTVVNTNDPNGYGKVNYSKLMEQLEELKSRLGFTCKITDLEAAFEESQKKEMKLLEDIVRTFEPDDIITADLTYGNKPSPMVLLSALSYADNFCENTFVNMLVYGGVAHGANNVNTSYISDVTSLFYMNSLINRMSLVKPEDPLGMLKKMIEL